MGRKAVLSPVVLVLTLSVLTFFYVPASFNKKTTERMHTMDTRPQLKRG